MMTPPIKWILAAALVSSCQPSEHPTKPLLDGSLISASLTGVVFSLTDGLASGDYAYTQDSKGSQDQQSCREQSPASTKITASQALKAKFSHQVYGRVVDVDIQSQREFQERWQGEGVGCSGPGQHPLLHLAQSEVSLQSQLRKRHSRKLRLNAQSSKAGASSHRLRINGNAQYSLKWPGGFWLRQQEAQQLQFELGVRSRQKLGADNDNQRLAELELHHYTNPDEPLAIEVLRPLDASTRGTVSRYIIREGTWYSEFPGNVMVRFLLSDLEFDPRHSCFPIGGSIEAKSHHTDYNFRIEFDATASGEPQTTSSSGKTISLFPEGCAFEERLHRI